MTHRRIVPSDLSHSQRHHYLLGSVNPRPICFASTIDKDGAPNLAPYSFFNIFSSNPPVFIFSVNTRRDGSLKHTFLNAEATGEVVINLVNYDIARQMAIAGVEFDKGISEFDKAGLTAIPSEMVKPYRVKESPVQFECKVLETRSLSNSPGAANLIMAEAILIHMAEDVFNDQDHVNPNMIDTVGRLGNNNYSRTTGKSVFQIEQPPGVIVPGFDLLPVWLKNSKMLTGYELGQLAGVQRLPDHEQINEFKNSKEGKEWLGRIRQLSDGQVIQCMEKRIREFIEAKDYFSAWCLLGITE